MNKSKLIATAIVAALLAVAMLGLRHIDKLNDGIELKKIQIKDGSLKLKIYDQKLNEVDKQLREKTINAEEAERQRQKIEKENQELREQLQAKQKAKERDLAVKAQRAVTGTTVASAATGSCAEWMAAAGISHPDAIWLIGKESGCRSNAVNPSSYACGIAQELLEYSQRAQQIASVNAGVCPKSGCSMSDPVCQMKWMQNYTYGRYGSWSAARAFHLRNNWY